jgi:calcium-dependent protein kinase
MPKHVSKECKDFLSKMICVDPNKRITALEAIQHDWIAKSEDIGNELSAEEQAKLDSEIVQNLKKYRGESTLKKAAMNVLVKHLSSSEVENL